MRGDSGAAHVAGPGTDIEPVQGVRAVQPGSEVRLDQPVVAVELSGAGQPGQDGLWGVAQRIEQRGDMVATPVGEAAAFPPKARREVAQPPAMAAAIDDKFSP